MMITYQVKSQIILQKKCYLFPNKKPNQEVNSKRLKGVRMKRYILSSLVIVMVIAGYVYAQAAANFSGTWVLDANKSDLGMNNPAAKAQMNKVSLIIKQTETQLTIERSTGDTAVYNLDGSESVNNLPHGGQSKTTMHWVGTTLAAKTISNINGVNVEMTDERGLSADGKEMTLKITRQAPSGEKKQMMVYKKQ